MAMEQKDWDALAKAFEEEEPFWESRYADETDFEDLNLYRWLECNGARPSTEMIEEANRHGYLVGCAERDSFGWLVGKIWRKNDPSLKVITFG